MGDVMICLLIILLVLFPGCKWTELDSSERPYTPHRDEEQIEQEQEHVFSLLSKPPASKPSTPSSSISPDMKGLTWTDDGVTLTEQNIADFNLRGNHTPPIFKPQAFSSPTQVSRHEDQMVHGGSVMSRTHECQIVRIYHILSLPSGIWRTQALMDWGMPLFQESMSKLSTSSVLGSIPYITGKCLYSASVCNAHEYRSGIH